MLFGAVAVACIWGPRWPDGVQVPVAVAGGVAALAGAAVVVLAGRALGGSLTPFPKPPPDGALVVDGPYRVVRHPIYSGALLLLTGLSLIFSPLALAAAGLLAAVWALKSGVEERFLRDQYPEYGAYSARVRSRLVPFLY